MRTIAQALAKLNVYRSLTILLSDKLWCVLWGEDGGWWAVKKRHVRVVFMEQSMFSEQLPELNLDGFQVSQDEGRPRQGGDSM